MRVNQHSGSGREGTSSALGSTTPLPRLGPDEGVSCPVGARPGDVLPAVGESPVSRPDTVLRHAYVGPRPGRGARPRGRVAGGVGTEGRGRRLDGPVGLPVHTLPSLTVPHSSTQTTPTDDPVSLD